MEERHTLFIMLSEFLSFLEFKTALDFQFRSSISTDDAAEISKSVYVRKFFTISLDWAPLDGNQRHNFDLLAANVEANLLWKGVKASSLLLNVRMGM